MVVISTSLAESGRLTERICFSTQTQFLNFSTKKAKIGNRAGLEKYLHNKELRGKIRPVFLAVSFELWNSYFFWEIMEKSEIREWISTLAARIDHIRDWL